MNAKHWRLDTDTDNIAWLTIDKADASMNVLSQEVMVELNDMLNRVEAEKPKALIIRSGKKSGFIAGADITEFETMKSSDEAFTMVRQGQQVLDKLEALPFTTIAMLNGVALGGGFELALACDYRVMVSDGKAVVGFPEVKLGICPGFGGTVRATQLAGVTNSMSMMLTGKNVYPKPAKKMGLVDQLVAGRHLERAAKMLALKPTPRKARPFKYKAMDSLLGRKALGKVLRKQVSGKAKKAHYPAPYKMIELWENYGHDPKEMMVQEARTISNLMVTDTSRNLVRVFGLQNKLKSGSKSKHSFKHVHVVGAGVMGGDIATWCAYRGMTVSLQDREAKYVAPALERAHKFFLKKTRDPMKAQLIMDRLIPDVDGECVQNADVVIEAIYENLEAKKELYARLETSMKDSAILATNTSSIDLKDLCTDLKDPSRLIGLHFFNPVTMMPLVEVIGSEVSSKTELEKGMAFTRKIDRLPLACKSAAGFVVNRVLMPYMSEAGFIAEEGVPLVLIDKAATNFGMPMGPIELMDTVAPADLADRMIYRYLNEAVAVLHDGIVEEKDLLDAGMIFGTGFAPFLGGPLNYVEKVGAQTIYNKLKAFTTKYGERFQPSSGWKAIYNVTDEVRLDSSASEEE